MPPATVTTQAQLESLTKGQPPIAILFYASWNQQSVSVLAEFNKVSCDCALASCEIVDDLEDIVLDLGVNDVPIVQIYGSEGKLLGQSIGGTMENADSIARLIQDVVSKSMDTSQDTRDKVRNEYAKTATGAIDFPGGADAGWCGEDGRDFNAISAKLGYTEEELKAAGDANLGLGCGSPLKIADLKEGERVVDLGSGAGMDCFICAAKVGAKGHVIGVDMTPEMLSKARKAVKERGVQNLEFRLGEIEYLPVQDSFADVVISNCVINLSTDKGQVFREAFRVLRPGGRVAISDVIAEAELPERLKTDQAYACWVGGAPARGDVEAYLKAAGFADVSVTPDPNSREVIKGWMPGSGAEEYVVSAHVRARKPGGSSEPVTVVPCKRPPECGPRSW